MTNQPHSVKKLIQDGEHQQQDFKFRIDDQRKIARTIAAFANTDGGRLLIGVKDNGKIAGVNPEEEYHMIEGAAALYCQPAVQFESRIWQEEMKLVLEIMVPPNPERHHKAPDDDGIYRIWVRTKDHTILANKIQLLIWKYERKGIPKPQVFGDNEQKLLQAVQDNEKLTLSKMYRILPLPKALIDRLVSILVYWKVLEMVYDENATYYRLSET